MIRNAVVLASTLALVAVFGCQREDTSLSEKLDQIDERLASIEKKIGQGGGAPSAAARAKAKRQRRPRPEPNEVYAAPVDGAPCEGPDTAKVTVVEAFEFA